MSNSASAGGAAINLLQITDCHLTKDASGELLGVVTRESFDAVLDLVIEDIAKGVCPRPVMTLATGDLAQDASKDAYLYFKDQIQKLGCGSRWIPGNHDDRDVMAEAVNQGSELDKVIEIGGWQILMLDSSVKGKVHGMVTREDLSFLESRLKNNPQLHTLICLHHHPVAIDSTWLDTIGLHNRDAFFEIVDRYSNVRGILWGHIHQQFEVERNGLPLMASPSTCIQFTPRSHDFGVEPVAPGYRWLQLYENGDIESAVVRAENYDFTLDMESNGY